MPSVRNLIAGLAVFRSALVAADATEWMTEWSTTTCWSTKEAETMWSTEYSTTTCWSTETPSPVKVTIYDTITTSQTVYNTITSATTLEVPYTTTSVIEKDFTATIYSSYAQVVTSVATVTKVVVSTVTVASIATSVQTVVSIVPGKDYTATVIIQNTETVTQACSTPTSTLKGLVPCSSRITNEQGYVPPTPLPSTYLWGCPPGKLCKPKQVDCNFEAGLYASTYICAPEDCITAEQPPALGEVGGLYADDINSTCPFFETFDDYPLLAPSLFGLDYSEYAVSSLGIAATYCPPSTPPPPSTTTTTSTTSYSPLPPPVSTSTTQWLPWTTSSSSTPLPVSSSKTQWLPWSKSSSYASPAIPSTWSSYETPTPVASSSSWAEWAQSSSSEAYGYGWGKESATKSWSNGITPRALEARAGFIAPVVCQKLCDGCVIDGMYCGLDYPRLCPTSVSFQVAYTSCASCVASYRSATPKQATILLTDLNMFLDYCVTAAPKTTSVSAPAVQMTTTTTTPKAAPTTSTTTTASPSPATTSKTSLTPAASSPSTSSTTSTSVLAPPASSTSSSTTPPAGTTSSPAIPSAGETSTSTIDISTVCPVSESSDGQPEATGCAAATATSFATYTPGPNAAVTAKRPAAAMVIAVVVVVAMV